MNQYRLTWRFGNSGNLMRIETIAENSFFAKENAFSVLSRKYPRDYSYICWVMVENIT